MNNHIYLFCSFLLISLVNIISTTHFIVIMLAGVNFYIFSKLLREQSFYKLLWTIATFLVFEINMGFPIFSISLLAYFIYLVVVPYFKVTFSFSNRSTFATVIIFYSVLLTFTVIMFGFSLELLIGILLNILIDTIILLVLV